MKVNLDNSSVGPSGTNLDTSENGDLAKSVPKDAEVMAAILRDMGVMDWEPRVINQLLEFSYNYVTNVLEDAKMFSSHAQKKSVDVEDVRLAVQMFTEKNVTTPPSRDSLLEVARAKNISTLPIPKPNSGLRLPPDRFCLTACNYKLKSNKKQPPRSAPYSYGNASASNYMISNVKNHQKVVMTAPQNITPQFNLTPTGQVNRQIIKIGGPTPGGATTPTVASVPNKIQLQPPAGPRAMYTMTINPSVSAAGK